MDRAPEDPVGHHDDLHPHRRPWGRVAQDVAVTLWPSFLAAAVAAVFFFAFFDPAMFGEGATPPAWLDNRMAGYAVGFFFFWAIATLSSALTLYLVRSANEQPPRD